MEYETVGVAAAWAVSRDVNAARRRALRHRRRKKIPIQTENRIRR